MSTVRIQVRRGLASEWTSIDPILAAGEMGLESDTNFIKFGDGSSNWSDLSYANEPLANIQNALADYVQITDVGSAGGVVGLNISKNAIVPGSSIIVEGSTDNDFETTLAVTDPTADRTITFPDATGTVQLRVANVSDTEIGYLDGVTSAIQTQLGGKAPIDSPTFTGTVTLPGLPSTSLEAVTKGYVDNLAAGINFHAPVKAATTENITLTGNTNPVLIDVHTLVGGERILVKNQTNKTENGIYVYDYNTGNFTRAQDADNNPNGELSYGDFVFVEAGATQNGQGYVLHTSGAITLGTTELDYVQFNAAQTVVVGDGLYEPNPGVFAVDLTKITDLTSTQTLTNKRLTSPKINEDVVLSATASELNKLHGATATTSEINYLTGVTSSIQTQLSNKLNISTAESTYAPLSGATFSGYIVLPSTTTIGDVSGTELSYLNGVYSSVQDQLDAKLSTSSASTTYAPKADATLTGTVILPDTTSIGSVSATEIGYLDGVTSAIQTQLNAKAPIANPTFTGTVAGITKSMVGLGNVDNTSDANKPVSTATQTALDAKLASSTAASTYAPIASPTFTGTVAGITKSMVGLANVDNTSDANKPVSSATQTALDLKAPKAGPTFTGTLTAADVTISGNLTVSGTTTSVNATNLEISDPIIYIATGNNANANDIGLVGHFNNGTYQHSGLARDHSDGKWKLFSGITTEPTNTLAFGEATFDALKIGALEATTVTPSSGVVFSDGTQTKAGVPSKTPIATAVSSSTTLAGNLQNNMVPLTGAVTITIGDTSNALYAIGESIDFYQASGTGALFAKSGSVNLLYTPGLALRTTYSSATVQKVSSTDWLVYGDLKA